MSGFTASDVPDQRGRTALVTGANTGLGYWTAVHLARAGARVFIGARSPSKGEAAVAALRAEVDGAVLNTAEQGSWPSLMAATSPDVAGGDYCGPQRFNELSGPAGPARSVPAAHDGQVQRRRWDLSLQLTGTDPLAS